MHLKRLAQRIQPLLPQSVKHTVKQVMLRCAPRLVFAYRVRTGGRPEPEMSLLPQLCRHHQISIDVGAHLGGYTYLLAKYSRRCIAFEPLPALAGKLRSELRFMKKRIELNEVALSDTEGTSEIRVPRGCAGWSTIEAANPLTDNLREMFPGRDIPIDIHLIRKRTLDSYNFSGVGFIKIDVEGHEANVLAGGKRTLEAERPRLLIEIEDRHNPTARRRVDDLLSPLGYLGFFLFEGYLRPLAELEPTRHQNPSALARRGAYINNFLFIDAAEVPALRRIVPFS